MLLQLLALSLALLGTRADDTPSTNITTGFVNFPNTTREVSWSYANDLVIYDGDIIFGTVAEFNDALVNVTQTPDGHDNPPSDSNDNPPPEVIAKRSYSVFGGVWPGGVVKYRYADAYAEQQLSTYVSGAINIWSAAVPSLKFQKLPYNAFGSDGVVTIRTNNPRLGYCAASQFYTPNAPMWIYLDRGGECDVPDVLHAFGHVLGLIHEHQRPDQSLYLNYVCDNIVNTLPFPPTCCGKPKPCGLQLSFEILTGYWDASPFDLDSIMLLPSWTVAKPSTYTLTKLNGDLINPLTLSPSDIARVCQLYGCPADGGQPECPKACNPAPGKNKCSQPTAQTCVFPSPTTPNPRPACACRAGYKATGVANGDTTKQWRLPADEGNFRVWVAENVPCDTLCNDINCSEVKELPASCLHN